MTSLSLYLCHGNQSQTSLSVRSSDRQTYTYFCEKSHLVAGETTVDGVTKTILLERVYMHTHTHKVHVYSMCETTSLVPE